jgi:hypothetical protein
MRVYFIAMISRKGRPDQQKVPRKGGKGGLIRVSDFIGSEEIIN